jgi:hypothetical protein
MLVEVGKRSGHEHIHPPQQVVLWNHVVQSELIEQLPLVPILPPHPPSWLQVFRTAAYAGLKGGAKPPPMAFDPVSGSFAIADSNGITVVEFCFSSLSVR